MLSHDSFYVKEIIGIALSKSIKQITQPCKPDTSCVPFRNKLSFYKYN